MPMQLSSPAFAPGAAIPRRYTGEGEDISPPLQWTGVPEGTQELALICDDPDAPTSEPWVHWVLYKIPPHIASLPEGLPKTAQISQPLGALQGKNSWTSGQTIGYRGPMPPPGHGLHHYRFTLYALDSPLNIQSGETKKTLLSKMQGHILDTATLIGTYQR